MWGALSSEIVCGGDVFRITGDASSGLPDTQICWISSCARSATSPRNAL
jgi:hypothetical protein